MIARLTVCITVLIAALAAPPASAAQQRLAVFTEAGTPVIATEILLAAGAADEDAAQAGVAYLAARSVTDAVQPMLDSLGAHLSVEADKDAIAFSLITAPEVWEEASRLLMVALFRDAPDSLAVARQRREINAALAARESNPADALAREADAAFFGPDHPWGRPTVGYPQTVLQLSTADVAEFLRDHFTSDRAVAAVVGPVDPERVREHLRDYLPVSGGNPPGGVPPQPVEGSVRRDYNTITTWLSASFPVAPGADMEALRMLAHLATEELSFGPSRRSVFNARAQVMQRAGGGELRLQVVVPPEEAEEWAGRVVEAVTRFADEDALAGVFEGRLRRYRGERLLDLAAPEARAHAAARQLLLGREAPSATPRFDALTAERVREAALALDAPVVVFLGPFLDDGDSAADNGGR